MYKIVIDGQLIEKEKRIELELYLYDYYGFYNASSWFNRKKIPDKLQDMITYCELGGEVIFDASNTTSKFEITIDGQNYKTNHRINLINEVELKHNINGVASWFDRETVPFVYSNRVSYMRKGDLIICDGLTHGYKYTAIIDNIKFENNQIKLAKNQKIC